MENSVGRKIAKKLFESMIKHINPAAGMISGPLLDEIDKSLGDFIDKSRFSAEFKKEMERLYPDRYGFVLYEVEHLTESCDITDILLKDDFDFKKAVRDILKDAHISHIDDTDMAALRTGLTYAVGLIYEELCAPENDHMRKLVIETVFKDHNRIDGLDSKFNEWKDSFSTTLRSYGERIDNLEMRVDDHEIRISILERENQKSNADCSSLYRDVWFRTLFLEEISESSAEKTLSDVYVAPIAERTGKSGQTEELAGMLTKDLARFNLILGDPGVGKSTFITAYLNGRMETYEGTCLVIPFSDHVGDDLWEKKEMSVVVNSFLSKIGIPTTGDMQKLVLFFDGFDEMSMTSDDRIEFLVELSRKINTERYPNYKIFVTCRKNYMDNDKIKQSGFSAYELLPFDEDQIEEFCRKYSRSITDKLIGNLKEKKYLYGYPIILYMSLSTGEYVSDEKNTVQVYKKMFECIYERAWDHASGEHRYTTHYGDFYNKLAQKMAIYMFEHGDAAEGCPAEVISNYAKILREKYGIDNIPELIGGFYKTHLTENKCHIFFVHRTIYEYFFTDYLAETIRKHLEDNGSDWFIGNFCGFMQFREMSDEMTQFLLDNVKEDKERVIEKIKIGLEKCLDNEQLSLEIQYLKRTDYEHYVLSNCLRIINKGSDSTDTWHLDSKNCDKYLRATPMCLDITYYLDYFDFRGSDLRGVNLRGAHLEEAHLEEANLEEANLERASLERAYLERAYLDLAHLEVAHLGRAHLEGVHLERAYLERTHLEEAYLGRAHLEDAYLEGAHLEGAHLEDAHLEAAHLEEAYLEGAHLERAHLEGAHLEGAHLEKANLKGAHLEWANLERANLEKANLEGANLEGAHLKWANLKGANLKRAYLERAYLERAIGLQE